MSNNGTFIPRNDLKRIADESDVMQENWASPRLSPSVPVEDQTAEFIKIAVGETSKPGFDLRRNTDGTFYRVKWATEGGLYTTREYGVEAPVDNVTALRDKKYFSHQAISAKVAKFMLMYDREKRVQQTYQEEARYDVSQVATASNVWTDLTNADPYADISLLSAITFANFGWERENLSLIITRNIVKTIFRSDAIVTNAKYTSNMETVGFEAKLQYLADFLDVKEVIPVEGVYNNSGIGLSKNFAKIWQDGFINLCYIGTGGDMTNPGFSKQPIWTPYAKDDKFESYDVKENDSKIIRARSYRGNFTDYQFGSLLKSVA